MRECLLNMARAWALVKLMVDSSLMDKMQSPTAIRPSLLMAPPWIMLRTITPKPSLLALTVIPVVMEEHRCGLHLRLSNSLSFESHKNPYELALIFQANKKQSKWKTHRPTLKGMYFRQTDVLPLNVESSPRGHVFTISNQFHNGSPSYMCKRIKNRTMDGKLVQNIEKLCATTLFPSHLFIQFRLLICLLCAKCYVGGLR